MSDYRLIEPGLPTPSDYNFAAVMALIVTHDQRLLFQHRDNGAPTYKHHIATFGGAIDAGEMPLQATVRELGEELGAVVHSADLMPVGSIYGDTPNGPRGRILEHIFIWQAAAGAITGCYEGSMAHFDTIADVLAQPLVVPTLQVILRDARFTALLNGLLKR